MPATLHSQRVVKARHVIGSLAALSATIGLFACNDLTHPIDSALHPGRPGLLINPAGTIAVSPGGPHGWRFYDDQHDTTCTVATVCRIVQGPLGAPLGAGSAELATPVAGDGKALLLSDYSGTRFDQITTLQYATYRQSVDGGNNLAIALQLNADYDLTDASTVYQGRLVFEPYQGIGGNVPQNTWQIWNAKAGKWWGTKSSVTKGGATVSNPCVQASPCTWAELLASFPDVGVHSTLGAILLKAGSNWSGFRGNVDALTIGVNGVSTTFNFEFSEPVPALSPTSTPQALFDSLGVVQSATGHGMPWVRSIVSITFKTNASQADRQAVVDGINGSVVGGFRVTTDGSYYVRIPGSTDDAIPPALAMVQASPSVDFAGPFLKDTLAYTAYRKPHDGAGWNDWRLSPESTTASRFNWPLEATSAPAAWGCSVGDAMSQIAIVDQGIIKTSTIGANVEFAQRIVPGPPPTAYHDHGTIVAEMLGAVGDDTLRSTGMMWTSRLALWDIYVDQSDSSQTVSGTYGHQSEYIAHYVYAAGLRGAKIINLSMSVPWEHMPRPQDADSADTTRRELAHRFLVRALRDLQVSGKTPLVVIAAGNDTLDAKWAGYTEAKVEFPNQILIVGSSTATGQVAATSNTGSLVDLYAPGDGVWAFGRGTLPHQEFGTSFAAPLVSGVAGLLTGFDPSLGISDLRARILQGARTPASAGGKKLLDAYGALRQAAKRPGAPLCGNQRVWIENHNLYVARDSGGTAELLGSIGSAAWGLNVYHGGKWIDYQTASGFGHLRYDGTHWVSTTDWDYDDLPGGSYASSQGRSHDWNAGIFVDWAAGNTRFNSIPVGTERVRVVVYDTLGNSQTDSVDVSAGTALHMKQTMIAVRAYPQRGDTGYFVLTRMKVDINEHPYVCDDDRGIPGPCTDPTITWRPDTSLLYSVNVRGGPPTIHFVRALPDTMVYSMSFSEDDLSTAIAVGSEQDFTQEGGTQTHNWCQVRYLNGHFAGTPQQTIVTADACPFVGDADGTGGGFANRVPAHSSLGRLMKRIPSAPHGSLNRHSVTITSSPSIARP